MSTSKKIVIIGGTGLIGTKTSALLRAAGHEVVIAAPSTGINSITGEGLAQALQGADVVIDVSNSPSFEPAAVLSFFETSTRNLLAAEKLAGVAHHVALSIVGTDRMPGNGYFQAKVAQENLIKASGQPYTIVRSTQFLEFLQGIADFSANGNTISLAGGQFQPIAADDVAILLAGIAIDPPHNSTVEIAGPERAPFDVFVRRYLELAGDSRTVERNADALYFGGRVEELSLVPTGKAALGKLDLPTWFAQNRQAH